MHEATPRFRDVEMRRVPLKGKSSRYVRNPGRFLL